MADADLSTVEGPGRRRESWSLKTIVENVSGRPITDFQDPARPVHPYIVAKLDHFGQAGPRRPSDAAAQRRASMPAEVPTEDPDPVEHVYPPLTGPTGRMVHGPEHEHHSPTLRSLSTAQEPSPGRTPHSPGPSRQPERIYLHYLLLHLDRLNDHALQYLKRAVDEEVAHREMPPKKTAGGSLPP